MNKLLAVTVLALIPVGCCPPGTIHVTALDPALKPVVDDYEKYVATGKKADGTDMSPNYKQVRVDAIRRLREVVDAAKANDQADK